jgi:response regulator RpfG family c-di-GMP phosphodiesterase
MAKVGLQLKHNNAELISARCERGAEIARKIGLSENAAQAIRALDEHWDGDGFSEGRKGTEIPLLAQIMNVSQTLDVFAFRSSPTAAVKVVNYEDASRLYADYSGKDFRLRASRLHSWGTP